MARSEGRSFDEAWGVAVRPDRPVVMTNTAGPPVGAVLWPTDSRDRMAWRAAVLGARDAYRRAYERRPVTSREAAITVLVGVMYPDGFQAGVRIASVA